MNFIKTNWIPFTGLAFLLTFFFYFVVRYNIGLNNADRSCLYAHVFLVDTWDKNISRGDLAAFKMMNDNAYYEKGLPWIKIVAGVAGDKIKVEEHKTTINGNIVRKHTMTPILELLNITISDINSQITIPHGEYFMMGETLATYDSRYWGTVKAEHIIGKVYAII